MRVGTKDDVLQRVISLCARLHAGGELTGSAAGMHIHLSGVVLALVVSSSRAGKLLSETQIPAVIGMIPATPRSARNAAVILWKQVSDVHVVYL